MQTFVNTPATLDSEKVWVGKAPVESEILFQ